MGTVVWGLTRFDKLIIPNRRCASADSCSDMHGWRLGKPGASRRGAHGQVDDSCLRSHLIQQAVEPLAGVRAATKAVLLAAQHQRTMRIQSCRLSSARFNHCVFAKYTRNYCTHGMASC
eukprot:358375-Chlamydomonas_euryale.AAC.17